MQDGPLLGKIGLNIRRHRRARRWTQETLAERATLSTYFIGSVERGQATLSLRSLQQIAQALEIPMKELFDGDAGLDRERLSSLISERMRRASCEELKLLLDLTSLVVKDKR